MGFLPDIQRILKQLPARRQNLLLSATMPGPIAQLAKQILHDPVAIQIERPSAPRSASPTPCTRCPRS